MRGEAGMIFLQMSYSDHEEAYIRVPREISSSAIGCERWKWCGLSGTMGKGVRILKELYVADDMNYKAEKRLNKVQVWVSISAKVPLYSSNAQVFEDIYDESVIRLTTKRFEPNVYFPMNESDVSDIF